MGLLDLGVQTESPKLPPSPRKGAKLIPCVPSLVWEVRFPYTGNAPLPKYGPGDIAGSQKQPRAGDCRGEAPCIAGHHFQRRILTNSLQNLKLLRNPSVDLLFSCLFSIHHNFLLVHALFSHFFFFLSLLACGTPFRPSHSVPGTSSSELSPWGRPPSR